MLDENIRASIMLRLEIVEKAWKRIREEDDARRDRVLYLMITEDYLMQIILSSWQVGQRKFQHFQALDQAEEGRKDRGQGQGADLEKILYPG